jgi:glucokinase
MVRDYSLNIWTKTIVNLIYAYDPEIVILAGGIMKSESQIIPYIKIHLGDFGWASFDNYRITCTSSINDSALLSAEYLVKNLEK